MIGHGGAKDIIGDPEWLPHGFSADGASVSFVRVTRELHRSLPFVDERQLRDLADWAVVPVEAIVDELATIDEAPLHFVFHTAFCCSTLLVNALASTGRVTGMKEPAIFVSLMQRLEAGEELTRSGRLNIAMQLLARPFAGTDATVVKPTCFANPLIPQLFATVPEARAVLLHSSIRSFLYSVAKRGVAGRKWGRQVYASAVKHMPLDLGYTPTQTWEQTDLQIAGLGWLMRRNHFNCIAARYGRRRVMQLEDTELTEIPAQTLSRVTQHFRVPATANALRELAAGPVFQRHSKSGSAYSSCERDLTHQNLAEVYADEVEPVAQWIEAVAEQRAISLSAELRDMRLAG